MRSFIFLCLIALCAAQAGGRRRPAQRERPPQNEPPVYEDEFLPPAGDAYYASECPEPYGFFADAEQCDKYYQCVNYTIKEKLCEDGMAFVDYHHNVERCDFLFNVNCTDRPKLQPAQKSLHCERAHGFFPHEDKTVCDKFYQCSRGKFNALTCPQALIFDPNTGTCVWPEAAKRPGCLATDVLNFTCPKQSPQDKLTNLHPRYADPNDCQYFYVCLNGVTPRRNGCTFGQVFSIDLDACDQAEHVPECADWYIGDPRYDEYLRHKTTTTTARPPQIRRRRPTRPRPVKEPVQDKVRGPARQPAQRQPVSVTDLVKNTFASVQQPERQQPNRFQAREPEGNRFQPRQPERPVQDTFVPEQEPPRTDEDRFFQRQPEVQEDVRPAPDQFLPPEYAPEELAPQEAPIQEEPAPNPNNRFRQRQQAERFGPFRRRFNVGRRKPVADAV